MAELLIRVIDKTSTDPYLDAKCLKRGDVVDIRPDGWVWGRFEYSDPQWRILRLPGIAAQDLSAFLAEEVDTDPAQPSAVLQARAFRLDIDSPLLAGSWLDDETRAVRKHRADLTLEQVLSLKIEKPPLTDPAVFG